MKPRKPPLRNWRRTAQGDVVLFLGPIYDRPDILKPPPAKGPRKRGSGLNRYKNHPPQPRKPWHLVTDWTAPLKEIAALVGATIPAVRTHIKKFRK